MHEFVMSYEAALLDKQLRKPAPFFA